MMSVRSGAARRVAGKPREIVSVRPVIRNSVPSVVTKDGTPSLTVMSPIDEPDQPRRPQRDDDRQDHRQAERWRRNTSRKGASAKTWPTDRSISPQISSMISPQAMMTGAATNCDTVCRFIAGQEVAVGQSRNR